MKTGRPCKPLEGETFGRLEVVARSAGVSSRGGVVWDCRCACGALTRVRGGDLRAGRVSSCGCLKSEMLRASARHGHSRRNGCSRAYRAWCSMKSRCSASKKSHRARYFERGVSFCKRWEKFENFLADMGEPEDGMTLDRVNNSRGYSKNNCRWASQSQQVRNRERTLKVRVGGVLVPLAEAAEACGKKYGTVYMRIYRGMPVKEALQNPVKTR